MILIIGGNSSGKSAYAERLACQLQSGEKLFVATMYPYSAANQKRIEERQNRRRGKGFTTVECFTDLKNVLPCEGKTVLLERITNLVTNEMYMEGGANVQAVGRILADVEKLKETKKSLFVTLRNANRSASQLQDLMTGSRLVHIAAADMVKRMGEDFKTRSGYSQIGGVAAATSADSVRTLRSKFPNLFLLVDGYDYSNANAKNCSFAFDKLGHGAIVCGCDCVLSAWKDEPNIEPIDCVVSAAERMKKNLNRYISIL